MPVHSPTSVNGDTTFAGIAVTAIIDDLNRPPRLPRWTRQEILILIQGKKVAENRVRRLGRGHPTSAGSSPSAAVEPKWASVASYCRRHGVTRGPVQCRKRWSNLSVDFKKIKEWESRVVGGSDSFWIMRSDVRRQRKLPGFFDREVYEILEGGASEQRKIEEEGVFDDQRRDADGLVAEFEQSGDGEGAREELGTARMPISEKQDEPDQGFSEPGEMNEKQQEAMNSTESMSHGGGQKRKRQVSPERSEDSSLQNRLTHLLDQSCRMLTAQLEAENKNCQLDRDQREGLAESLVGVLGQVADALGRIADKL